MRGLNGWRLLVSTGVGGWIGIAAAGSSALPVLPEESDFLTSLPIVLTPSRLPQAQNEAPGSVTVLDRELIRATGYRDIPRLLRLVPGMQVGQERNNSHWVTYHGMGNDYPSWMQVLVDGRSVYAPANFDGVDWGSLPVLVEEIERIEVVRGTNSAAYGSNAVLGVINIVTRHSLDAAGTSVQLAGGNAAYRALTVEHGIAGDQGVQSVQNGFRLTAGWQSDEGFDGLHDGRRVAKMSLRSDCRLGEQDELTFRLGGSQGQRDLGYPDSTFGNNAERQADFNHASLHLQWRHTPAQDEEWMVHYYRNQDRVDEAWQATAPPALGSVRVPLDRNRTSRRDSLEWQHRKTWSDTMRTVWGGEWRDDRIDAPFLYYGKAHQTDTLARLFAQTEWRAAPEWTLNASGLLEKFAGDAPHFSPRFFANWMASPESTWRAGYARAWRQPFMFERQGDVQAWYQGQFLVHPYAPNPDLQASRIDSWELGYFLQSRAWQSRLDLRVFQERIRQFITRASHPEDTVPLLAGTLPTATYENLESPVVLTGLEYQIESRPWSGARVLFGHALIERKSDDPRIAQLTAPYTANLSWFQEWGSGWSSALTVLRMGPIAGGSGFVPKSQYVSAPYTTTDAHLARRFRVDGQEMEIALTGTNLGGRHQEIADRSQQFLHGSTPVNTTSPTAWLSLSWRAW